VSGDGTIRWRKRRFFISTSLAGEHIAVNTLDRRYQQVVFANIVLGSSM